MGKKLLRGYILIALIFVVYVAAMVSFEKTTVFWISFCFSLLAFLVQVYTLYIIMKKQELIKDRIYDFPMIRTSALYLAVQLLASLLLMGFSVKIPIFSAVLVEVIILAVAALGLFAVEASKTEAVRQDIQTKKKLLKMEELQSRINLLVNRCDDGQIRGVIQKLAEEVRYSNPVSVIATEDIEDEIAVLYEETELAALDGDMENTEKLCDSIIGLLRERDRLCKYGHN